MTIQITPELISAICAGIAVVIAAWRQGIANAESAKVSAANHAYTQETLSELLGKLSGIIAPIQAPSVSTSTETAKAIVAEMKAEVPAVVAEVRKDTVVVEQPSK
jgi:hypothetical protein